MEDQGVTASTTQTTSNPAESPRVPRFCSLRCQPRKYGISFIVPDRISVEIDDRSRVRGRRPLRIFRVPRGGPRGYHVLVEQAKLESPPLKTWDLRDPRRCPNPRKAYHRSRFNDWLPQLLPYP